MTTNPPRAGRREWTALAASMPPLLLVSMDVSVLYFAIPQISADLDPSGTQQLWIFDIYGFVLAGLLMTMGALGDRVGRRRLLLLGAVAFGAASLLAAYAHSAETLIAAPRGPRHRRRHPDAVDDGAGPHDVHRPRPAGEGDRAVVRGDDGRDRARLGDERRPRGALLVGLGFLAEPADGPAADPRSGAAPGVQEPLPRPLRPAERPAVDGGGPARGSTASRSCPPRGGTSATSSRSPSACCSRPCSCTASAPRPRR
ncbi:hypothetical protein STANM309S_05809 [Streptomyces tanashiensis]